MNESLPEVTAPKEKSARRTMPSLEDALKSEKAGAHVMAARRALRKGDRDQTRALLKQAFSIAPEDAGALELLGDLFLEEGEQAKAVAVLARGAKLYPRHAAFEEKIALANLDLAEIERDKIARRQFVEQGDIEAWQDRKPGVSAALSIVMPGLGQVYNDEWERGALFCGASVVTLTAWLWPLSAATRAASAGRGEAGNARTVFEGFATALTGMGAVTKLFLILMFLGWLALYAWSAWDAAQIANRASENRKRSVGIWE